ncbi:unnamed protein product [Caenorhabditis brenneri]
MTTSDYSPSGVRVSLSNADLWQKFHPKNEMVATKSRSKLSPELEVKIEGLIPDALYTVSLYLKRVNNIKYTFSTRTGQWKVAGYGNEILPIDKKQHRHGVREGEDWMRTLVSFSGIWITSDPERKHCDDLILVSTMHKYQPVITVRRLSDGIEEEFRLTMTEFMVVTRYVNREIAELKKALNKNTFRIIPESLRDDARGKKRAITSNQTSTVSSFSASSSINTVGSPASSPAKKTSAPIPILSSVAANNSQVQMKISPAPTAIPSYVAPTNFQNQLVASPTMAPILMGLNNLQIPMINLPVMTSTVIAAFAGHNFAMWNMLQNRMTPTPPQQQWNLMPGAAQLDTQASHSSMEPDLLPNKAKMTPTSDSVIE